MIGVNPGGVVQVIEQFLLSIHFKQKKHIHVLFLLVFLLSVILYLSSILGPHNN